MFKKMLMALCAAVAVLGLSLTASAATYTSPDGVLSIELPNDSWKEMADETKWIALSDGADTITIDHYSNGAVLPPMSVADDHYVNVYQAVFSTQNEVFIITGSVVDASRIPEICNTILSAKVLQYNTKVAMKKNQEAAVPMATVTPAPAAANGGFTVASMSGTWYVAVDSLNVRSSWSTNDAILGKLSKGTAVNVKGAVQQNGADYGWYQIDYQGQTGYVNAGFLSQSAPAAGTAAGGIQYTGKVKTIYEIDGHAVTVYEATDQYWYDSEGHKYTQITDYDFEAYNGATLTVNKPNLESAPSGDSFTAYWLTGNAITLTPYSDGYYYSEDWIRYSSNGNGTYTGADGTTLYDYLPDVTSEDNTTMVQCPYCGDWFEEGNVFRNHYCPARDAANTEGEDVAGNPSYVDAIFLSGGLTLYSYDGYTYVDDYGTTYWEEEDGWTNGDGNYFVRVG